MATDDGVDNHDDDDNDGDDHERDDINADDSVHGGRYRFPRATMHASEVQELLSSIILDLLKRASSTTLWQRYQIHTKIDENADGGSIHCLLPRGSCL